MPALSHRTAVVVAVVLALLWPSAAPPVTRALDTVTFIASADAQVNEGRPTSNYGPVTTLRVRDASNDWRSFVQFTVVGLTGAPNTATLRLWVTDASPDGGTVSTTDNGWSESGITWATAPAIGSTIGELGSAASGTWVEVDVTTAIGGNGTVSFVIASGNGNSVVYSSREGDQAPQLVLVTGSVPPPPPPAPVADFTASPTSGTAPLTVAFTDASTNTPTSWAWDFDGDGSTDSTVQNPSFTYATVGSYSVTLTATNAGGSHSVTRTDLISVGSVPPPPPPVDTITLIPTGDAYVNEGRPSSNYGSATTLRVRLASERYASLIRFDVTGLSGPPTAATLRLFVVDYSPSGGRVGITATTWSEGSVTWSNHPPIGASLAELGPAETGTWMEVDVTPAITGNGPVAFYLEGIDGNSVLYSSREGVQPAQLILGTGSGPPPPAPVASFTAAPTSGSAPLEVAFTDTSTNGPTAWAWDFDGDSTIDATSQNPSFTYASAGTYSVTLTVGNAGGTDSTTRTNLISVSPPPPPPAGSAVLVGAGDIARCTSTKDEETAELINAIQGTVFTAGDNVYDVGSAAEFANCYDPSWGQFKARTRPTAGNHDYDTAGAAGYFGYFGSAAGDPSTGYYSYDVGAWHIVSLNSECSEVSCSATSAQVAWLKADLAAHPTQCTMAIFHRPLFSSSTTTGYASARPLWQALYDADADVVVNGHAHIYERFAPQTPDGVIDSNRGIRQFTVGTGGASLAGIGTIHPNSQVRSNTSHGVMKFTLHASGYDWQFVPVPGDTLQDSGSETCH